jgi:hypothetical protein
MKELVSSIENGLKKISKGNITLIELEETVASSRELYERLLIVRYKVYENSILSNEESEELKVVDKQTEVKKEEKTIPEENKDIEIIFEEETNDIAEDSVIRFDLFDTPEIEPELKEVEILPEVEEEINPSIEEEVLPEIEINEEDLVEENLDSEEEIENTESENIEASKEIHEAPEISKDASDLFPKLLKIEKSIAQNYQVMPLETLIGSFTLNERLQFINELFDGSSDLFSSSIKRLDSQADRVSARALVAEFAIANVWDMDGEVVEDFMLKICSRYAGNLGN